MTRRVAIIGGGVSGLTVARLLRNKADVKVFEREDTPGGLVRCRNVLGGLFHICGGHVFNTKNAAVNDWFWSIFDKERDFIKADRHSSICLGDGQFVDYPIENHVYQLDKELQKRFYADIDQMILHPTREATNFGDFLLNRFGRTLYDLYFEPYNVKIWRRELTSIPLDWLDGKLPMPTPEEMLEANRKRLVEKQFVHSTFYYERKNGSQFLADKLADGTKIAFSTSVNEIRVQGGGGCLVNGEMFEEVVFCGNVKQLPSILHGVDLAGFRDEISALESHGTTAVFCETDAIPYSWFYQPSPAHQSHRFICTGNFSPSNNPPGKMTCTVEFTDEVSEDEISRQLKLMPFHPKYLAHHYSPYTYPIQHRNTRTMIEMFKQYLEPFHIKLVGRFAEWEYYNMDAAMASAIKCFSH